MYFTGLAEQIRPDTHLLLVTDGITWKTRINDLRKLVDVQNQGIISRVHTQRMAQGLEADLRGLRRAHAL